MVNVKWRANPRAKIQLSRLIQQAGGDVREGAREALRQNGEEGKAAIFAAAPRDDGELQSSIDWTFGDPPPGVLGAGDTPQDNAIPADLRISIYAGGKRAPHAHLVHNGTQLRVREDGRSTGVMSPQPFFWPYIRAFRRRWRARILRRTRAALNESLK